MADRPFSVSPASSYRDEAGVWHDLMQEGPPEARIFRTRSFSYESRDKAHKLAAKLARLNGWPFQVRITGATGRSAVTTYHPSGRSEFADA